MEKYSKGIAIPINSDRYQQFGSLVIHKYFLEQDKLLLKYPSLAPVKGLPQTKITSKFRTVIKGIIRTEEINYKLLQDLEDAEKNLFTLIMKRARLGDELDFAPEKMEYTEDDITSMFILQRGEIMAGNNNPELIEGIRKTISLLVKINKITQESADEILNDMM